MMHNPYPSPLDQAWLRYWVSVYGPDSRLRQYLHNDDIDFELAARPAPVEPEPAQPQDKLLYRLPVPKPPPLPVPKPPPKPRSPTKPRSPRKPREPSTTPKIERDIDRVTRLPMSDWAKQIAGDGRITGITLQDILDGIENYFAIFDGLRSLNPDAYGYFSRVGVPLAFTNTGVYKSHVHSPLAIVSPKSLPSFFGVFLPRSDEEVKEDKYSLLDFHMFEKPKNFATVAPFGTTVFSHNIISLKRDGSKFTRKEIRSMGICHSWGAWWYIGVSPTGEIRALPHKMQRTQVLPTGDKVHHSGFMIPPALYEIKPEVGPHEFVRQAFNVSVALATSGLSGIQITVQRGKKSARFGVPVSALKGFFSDRDPNLVTHRRKPIIHFRHSHDRHMADGRIIPVGEHLSGERFFTWRGYNVTIGVPGIHYPSPEGFTAPLYIVDYPDAPLPSDVSPDELIKSWEFGKIVKDKIWTDSRAPIRHGQPTTTFSRHTDPADKDIP
jgi:hypothetical protein